MIKVIGDYFLLETDSTSYVFYKEKSGHLIHLHYGDRISDDLKSLDALRNDLHSPIGNAIYYSDDNKTLFLEVAMQEVSTRGKGDLRNPMVEIEHADGLRTSDFLFESSTIVKSLAYNDLPSVKDDLDEGEALLITLLDKENAVELKIAYTVFSKDDVITRKAWIKNLGEGNIKLLRAFSLDLDLRNDNYYLKTFHGHWSNEMNEYDQKIVIGSLINESLTGTSSNRANPFVILHQEGTTENCGKAYGLNILYSGNHQESVEADTLGNLRVLSGMNPTTFSFSLKKDEIFEVPEGVMSFSSSGYQKLSLNLSNFIRDHIVEEEFRYFPRRVLNNSWEACYFNFNEAKLLSMARKAKNLGCELFVLDDGWFGERNNDTLGLGDWTENKKKLPHGLKGLSRRLKKMGLDFGIWVEPEMVNENSNLYRAHPEWALQKIGHSQSKSRQQMILDLTNEDVVNYLYESMCYVFSEAECTYVKWDMNRCFSDYFSMTLPKEKMDELHHRYYLGLYSLFKRLKAKFPDILFEGCASGGNRFDLGILSYMPQIWASDDTDPFMRMRMQYNYSYGYPLSTLGCHVASSPCMTTLRRFSLEDRFSVALYGAFGYEIDLRAESLKNQKKIKEEIAFYKSIRDKVITMDFYRIKKEDNYSVVEGVSKDKSLALFTEQLNFYRPLNAYSNLKVMGLDPLKNYQITTERKLYDLRLFGTALNYVLPIHIRDGGFLQWLMAKCYHMKDAPYMKEASGVTLNAAGLNLTESFSGAGFDFTQRIQRDLTTRLYVLKEIK